MCEAQPIVEYFKLKKLENRLFSNGEIFVFVGGVGAKTAHNLGAILHQFTFEKIINIGIAGCGDKSVKIGELFCTNKKVDGVVYKKLITVDTPQNVVCSKNCLFDMEGRYFFDAAKEFVSEENIFVFKVVSDHLDSKILDKDFVNRLIKNTISEWYKLI